MVIIIQFYVIAQALLSLSWGEKLPSYSIMQGMTNSTSTQIIVLRPTSEELQYHVVSHSPTSAKVKIVSRTGRPYSSWIIDRLVIENLNLDYDYRLQVFHNTVKRDERLFRALSIEKPRDFQIAMASCLHDDVPTQRDMWDAVDQARPEILFLLGDTVYADFNWDGSVEGIWRRYVQTRRTLQLFKLERLIPTLATWDDHDYGSNDATRDFAYKTQSQAIFKDFFASLPTPEYSLGLGVGSRLIAFGQQFYLMDDRSWRAEADSAAYAHWGQEQEEWLLNNLNQNLAPAWIMNGSQFFGGYLGKDSYEYRHPKSFRHFLKNLKEAKAPLVFASGDVHFSELMTIEREILGYPTVEMTSSSIHSLTFPWHQHRFYNPRRLRSTWRHNFLLVRSAPRENGFLLDVRSIGEGNEELFQESFNVSKTK
jgi:alkaline phosphatase D